jgi:hypothetical protein
MEMRCPTLPWVAKTALVAQVLATVCAGFSTHLLARPSLERLYEAELSSLGTVHAVPLRVKIEGEVHVLLASSNGHVVAIQADTGEEVWRLRLPRPADESASLIAAPVRRGRYLVLSYATTQGPERVRHLVSVVDVRAGTLADAFPTLELSAEKPAAGGGVVPFNPPTSLSRAALAYADGPEGELGYVYVPFGNRQDIQPWHGWIFELDLEAWRAEGPGGAISAVLLTTPENECPVEGESGSRDMICGGMPRAA